MAGRRRKGERPVDKRQFYSPYDDSHPVARAIRTGSRWFEAWQFQNAVVLASAYGVQPTDIIASLPDPALLIRPD